MAENVDDSAGIDAGLTRDTDRTVSFRRVLAIWQRWWRTVVVGTVDQAEVVATRREESGLTARYLFMLAMAAGIAVLGLLLSSPAVVIGAMLLSPLMGPIIGLGFGLASGDYAWMRTAARALAVGTAVAVALSAFVVWLSPLQTVTAEIAARTRPTFFDLLVALFSALAGAYAMIRGREGTIVGVAIATALMPPLAVVGFGLATLNWTVFSGALLLYVTNLLTIAITAAVMARLYGFSAALSPNQTRYQTIGIVLAMLILAVPLVLSLRQIAWEAQAARMINGAVRDEFDPKARVSQLDISFDADPIRVTAAVLTPDFRPAANSHGERVLTRQLGRPIDLEISQYRVGTGQEAAEAAELAAARAREQEQVSNAQMIAEMTRQLALVAGVKENQVLVDGENRRAVVSARTLAGAELSAYRDLEQRVAALAPDWSLELRPPARPLPDLTFAEGTLDDDGRDALALIVWAGRRVDAPIRLSGPPALVEQAEKILKEQGVWTAVVRGVVAANRVRTGWGTPAE